MANKRDQIPDNIRDEIRILASKGISQRTIAIKFSVSQATVTRIVKAKTNIDKALTRTTKNEIKKRITGSDAIPPDEARPINKGDDIQDYQEHIARLALQKAKAVIISIDHTKIPEGQKAMTAAVLIDKARLISNQAGSITEHRDIQVVALKLLDTRKKASKVIDIRADATAITDAPEVPLIEG